MQSLKVGEVAPKRYLVEAKSIWNGTGLLVRPGERYIVTASDDVWVDRTIPSTAAGQPGVGIQKLFKPLIRCRAGQWFELIAAVGRTRAQFFVIGMKGRVALDGGQEGELLLFANDVIFAYGNNGGHVTVEVQREL